MANFIPGHSPMYAMSAEHEFEGPDPETEEFLEGQVVFKGPRKLGTLLGSDHEDA